MTEKLTVEDGRLKVERVEGKESLDVDLSAVDEVYFEKSPRPDLPGALILVTGDSQDVVRVDNDDAGIVMEKVWPIVAEAHAGRAQAAEGNRPESAPAPEEPKAAPAEPANRTRRASQRS